MGKKKKRATPRSLQSAPVAIDFPCPFCDTKIEGDAPDTCPSCARALVFCTKYRATRVLGRGGMGHVYAGVSTDDGRAVAIKILEPPKDEDWTAWELFERSSKVLADLHHPLLPKVYGFERTDSGRLVLVREAFDGGTLQERVDERDDRLSHNQVEKLLRRLLDVLAYLQGLVPPVIHRDIKPSNIMFRGEDWEPVLVDFDTIVSRRSGMTIVGTPGYAAPEQFSAEASLASDVYGLGATMLFVVTHTDADDLPREGGRFAVKELDRLGPDLARVLRKMVEPEALQRYESAKAALAALDDATTARAETPKKNEEKVREPAASSPPSGRPWVRYAILFGVAAILGGRAILKTMRGSSAAVDSSDTSSTSGESENARLERACNSGEGDSCFTIGLRYDNGEEGLTRDDVQAAKLYDRGCRAGNADCCNNLAVDYVKGEGVPAVDFPKAAGLYGEACEKKDALACRNLGGLYVDGRGVTKDPLRAIELRDKACDLGDGVGCELAGEMYDEATGVKRDAKKAASLYALGCDHGYSWSCRNSGLMYRDGDGVDKDERRAAALFKRACDDKEWDGCYQLGKLVRAGRGTEKDPKRAADLFAQACSHKIAAACPDAGTSERTDGAP